MLRRKRHADNAQMESDEVAAVKVLRTGARPMRARRTNSDDLNAFEPKGDGFSEGLESMQHYDKRFGGMWLGLELWRISHMPYPRTEQVTDIHSNTRASIERSFSLTKIARKTKTIPRCCVIAQHMRTSGQ